MKLFTSYNRILAGITLSGLIVIGFLFYQTLGLYINKQIEDHLYEELLEVKDFAHVKNIVPSPDGFDGVIIGYQKLQKLTDERQIFADTNFYNPKKKHQESARYLKTQVLLNGEPYEVKIIASKFESQEQIKRIVLIILLPLLILLAILWLVNRFLIRKMWMPFKQLLQNIKAFNINQEEVFKPIDTRIEEFRELNDAMVEVTLKIKSDYKEIKLFTENASHEMMTPLAVINSKLDTMLQLNSLKKEDSEILEDLYRATSKLTKLNQSLLLLVKIDNNQLQNKEYINLETLINEKILYFQEFIQERKLAVNATLDYSLVYANRSLIEILINNLFSNAIRHNFNGGKIDIKLHEHNLQFSNSSMQPQLDPIKIFERFYKDNASDGTGLGLAILKQVCMRQNYSLMYAYKQELHVFSIQFDNA
ncbi:sensor histidine kinase [Sphingobacterium faecium]|uniref:sensor histidine kinase n=1 Tax=Sphingobacterium faecium TaxID=34087 RepID=UPI00097F657F|nr:HAMP domain-containing sensor histidine kinase [Sphingobacterium faecium]WGQ14446.1 HAMP domain-containing sensor histidine kinase [Sphingobacterium faecium]SJN48012.1 Two component system histidine kinase [Sphingobacterium faecium PCAi_F2.5]